MAESDGRVEGVGLALIREGVWGFSLFGVAEALQGRGVGRELFARCWAYGEGARGHLILSSPNPQAMLEPTPTPGCRSAPASRRQGSPTSSGRRTSTTWSRPTRRASRWPTRSAPSRGAQATGATCPCRWPMARGCWSSRTAPSPGARGSSLIVLGARDEPAAQHVLWAVLTGAGPGATVNIDFLTAGQDWALPVCLGARLSLSPDGPMFAGGSLGPLAPYIPSGAYL